LVIISARVSGSRMLVPRSRCCLAAGCEGVADGWRCAEPAQAQARGEGLAGGAGVDDVAGIELLEGADGLPVVAELTVVVVFETASKVVYT
jgi:hypothetical protein